MRLTVKHTVSTSECPSSHWFDTYNFFINVTNVDQRTYFHRGKLRKKVWINQSDIILIGENLLYSCFSYILLVVIFILSFAMLWIRNDFFRHQIRLWREFWIRVLHEFFLSVNQSPLERVARQTRTVSQKLQRHIKFLEYKLRIL